MSMGGMGWTFDEDGKPALTRIEDLPPDQRLQAMLAQALTEQIAKAANAYGPIVVQRAVFDAWCSLAIAAGGEAVATELAAKVPELLRDAESMRRQAELYDAEGGGSA